MLLPILVLAEDHLFRGRDRATAGIAEKGRAPFIGGPKVIPPMSPRLWFSRRSARLSALVIPFFSRSRTARGGHARDGCRAFPWRYGCCSRLAGDRPSAERRRAAGLCSGSGRAVRDAFRADRLHALDRELDLLDRLHAGKRGATADFFYVCFAVALGSTIGIAFAKDLFTLFLFYEALTLSTYPLVTHEVTPKRAEGAALPSSPPWHLAAAAPAGDRHHLPSGRHPRFHARRHPPG